jgi:CheY-like chemotaxis protein
MKGDDQKALAAGCDGYITKPLQVRELARQVGSFLPARNETQEAP